MSARPCRVALVGMMGTGKSTIGRLLEEATGWPHLDNDELVRRETGTTPRQLVATRGEAAMREAESAALRRGLASDPPCILGIAAGTIVDAANRELLRRGALVVWLRADAEALARRALEADHRPWLDHDGPGWLRRTAAARDPLYASVADLALQTDALPPEATVAELVAWLRGRPACSAVMASRDHP